MSLDGLEALLERHFGRRGSEKARQSKVHLVRYADDFVITAVSQELLEAKVKPLVVQFLAERGLILAAEKTKVTHIAEGFDFLGWNIRKYDGKLLIKPSRKNVQAFTRKVRELVRANLSAKTEHLIHVLNPVIRGWAAYHRVVVAKRTFTAIDHWIWRKTWRWARRKHPKKTAGWVKEKYFRTDGSRSWVFAARTKDRRGKDRIWRLEQASATKIITHYVKVRGEANPFDPAWSDYFEIRLGLKMKDALRGRRKLLHLWMRQNGECPRCHQKITKRTSWHLHHIVRKIDGGSDETTNLMLLHPTCHRQMHNRTTRNQPVPEQEDFAEA